MAPFKFPLEQVLAYRRQLEEQAMQDLAKATAQRDEAKRRLEDLREDLGAQRQRLAGAAGLPAEERWLITGYIKALITDLETMQKRLLQLEELVDACRVHLVQKAQERELLDKLKEKQAKRHAHEERLKEQRDFDETATLRFKPAAV